MVFLTIVEAALLGLLAGTIVHTAAGLLPLSISVGLVVLVVYFGAFMWVGYRGYRAAWSHWQPLFPSPRPA
jgi:hypothetical protein